MKNHFKLLILTVSLGFGLNIASSEIEHTSKAQQIHLMKSYFNIAAKKIDITSLENVWSQLTEPEQKIAMVFLNKVNIFGQKVFALFDGYKTKSFSSSAFDEDINKIKVALKEIETAANQLEINDKELKAKFLNECKHLVIHLAKVYGFIWNGFHNSFEKDGQTKQKAALEKYRQVKQLKSSL